MKILKLALLAVTAFWLCLDRAEAKEHEIVVEGSRATIDGVPVARTIPYKDASATIISYDVAVRVLGPPDRSGYGHNDLVLVWDSLGFTMLRDGENPKDGQLWNFAVSLRKEKGGGDMATKDQFAGSLRVNGIPITSATRLKDIVPALLEQGFRLAKGTSTPCYCLDKHHYELVVGSGEDGLVDLFIFRSNQIIEPRKHSR